MGTDAAVENFVRALTGIADTVDTADCLPVNGRLRPVFSAEVETDDIIALDTLLHENKVFWRFTHGPVVSRDVRTVLTEPEREDRIIPPVRAVELTAVFRDADNTLAPVLRTTVSLMAAVDAAVLTPETLESATSEAFTVLLDTTGRFTAVATGLVYNPDDLATAALNTAGVHTVDT